MTWFSQLSVMIVKELKQLTRDRALLFFIIFIFTVNIFMQGHRTPVELNHSSVYFSDLDQSAESRELLYRFQPPYFQLTGLITSPIQGLNALDNGDASLLLDIPEHFAKTLQRGRQTASVQILVGAENSTLGYLTSSYAARIAQKYGSEWTEYHLQRLGTDIDSLPSIKNQNRIWYNPSLKEAWFNSISQLLTLMTVACLMIPASAMVREKERGTIEQLLVSPLSPLQIMLAKILAMIFVMLLGTMVSLFGIMQAIFDVPIRGNILLFFSVMALYTFTNAGLGLFLATFARNSAQVGMLVILTVMPIVMLSGTWTLLESMPQWLQNIMFFSPLRHFVDIVYGILLKGAGISTLWDSILIMTALGSILFLLGLWRFKKQFN